MTIGYSIVGELDPANEEQYAWIDDIMQTVSELNKLDYLKDVKRQTVGSPENFMDYIALNPNSTRFSIVWCTSVWSIGYYNITIPC